jgi:hypothetical protein
MKTQNNNNRSTYKQQTHSSSAKNQPSANTSPTSEKQNHSTTAHNKKLFSVPSETRSQPQLSFAMTTNDRQPLNASNYHSQKTPDTRTTTLPTTSQSTFSTPTNDNQTHKHHIPPLHSRNKATKSSKFSIQKQTQNNTSRKPYTQST